MFWADELLKNRTGPEVINDAWTPSGMVHMGSLKGPVMHDVLYRKLEERGTKVRFIYGFDDADPLDGLPAELIESHSKYLGIPIYLVPSPDKKGSFADFFASKLKTVLGQLGIRPEIYRTSEHYKNGNFDNAIRFVLDHAKEIRKVYEEIYKKKVAADWYPLQVICPNCGKLGTTRVVDWDREEVSFVCEPHLVTWAKGCMTSAKISPFKGSSKMPYKVEWASKWWTYGVTIEGAGKDHASAGGTYDVAMKVLRDVFKKEPPLKFTYEFFLSGGKKMSSSKGVGLNGEELLEVLVPAVARFLMLKTPPQRAVEFSPRRTDTIPKLYDEYEEFGKEYFSNPSSEEFRSQVFKYSQIGEIKKLPKVRFSLLVQWIQMPNMDAEIKKNGLEEWAKYARIWLEKYAPEEAKFEVKKEKPKEAEVLSSSQKKFLSKIADSLDREWDGEALQTAIYDIAKEIDISSEDAFKAIYISLIGKDHGPKAAWLILSLDPKFVKKRFKEV